ncbi:MAG: hypothetical protein M3P18_14920 [Actinomycetota bacterium]|nr:hypothetical protein [Actinomycetota bacterium]
MAHANAVQGPSPKKAASSSTPDRPAHTTLPAATRDSYADAGRAAAGPGSCRSSNNPITCGCDCGRRIRVAAAVLAAGPISCGLCGTDFTQVG